MYIVNVFNLMNLDICIHLWSHHYNRDNKHIYHLPKFPCARLEFFVCFVVRTFNMKSILTKILSVQQSIVNSRDYVVQQISRSYSPCITETLYPLNNNCPFPPPPQPLKPPFYSAAMSLIILNTFNKWNHAVFAFCDCLNNFTQHNFLWDHLCSHIWQDFLFFQAE